MHLTTIKQLLIISVMHILLFHGPLVLKYRMYYRPLSSESLPLPYFSSHVRLLIIVYFAISQLVIVSRQNIIVHDLDC